MQCQRGSWSYSMAFCGFSPSSYKLTRTAPVANRVSATATWLSKAQAALTLCHGVQHSCLLQVLPEGLFLTGLCCHVVSECDRQASHLGSQRLGRL